MDHWYSWLTQSPAVRLTLLGLLAVGLIAWAVRIVLRFRLTPAEIERRRRVALQQSGRMGDGLLTDVREDALFFSYTVRGVTYHASQPINDLRAVLPEDLGQLVGPVTVKYAPRNPANSIVVCEKWSGLRPGSARLAAIN